MSGHGDKLSRKHEAAIAALLSAPSLQQAAQTVGLHEKTLRRWLQQPAFARAYLAARRQVVDHAIAQSQHAASTAVRTLCEVMQTAVLHPSARVAAARAVLETATKGLEQALLEVMHERLEKLEAEHTDAAQAP